MLKDLELNSVLFLDIETVPAVANFDDLSPRFQELWEKKASQLSRLNPDATADQLYERAGIYAEFGKIVCISCGYHTKGKFRLKSFYDHDETKLLEEFARLINQSFVKTFRVLCAHNGKEFDFPYIARRMLINGINLPSVLDIAGKKPWEVNHLDTMELWKFGDYKHYTSLGLLTAIFDIPTPKDDIDGSMVGKTYWEEDDLERIAAYCQKDVLAIAQLLRRYKGLPLIKDEDVVVT